MAKKRKLISEINIKGLKEKIKVGDHIILLSQSPEFPFVARLNKLEQDENGNTFLLCQWYYRPEDTHLGRQDFHGANELFLSDHFDEQTADTVLGKCRVLSMTAYQRLKSAEAYDYFSRFEYDHIHKTFTPDQVKVYCLCELPYNPDILMVHCDTCKDWYEVGALGGLGHSASITSDGSLRGESLS